MKLTLPKDIKERRELAYLYKEFDDFNLPRQILDSVTDDEIVEHVIEFFVEGSTLVYPYKSYFVAMVYAVCMCHYFPKHFKKLIEPLQCVDLLDNDDFFEPYNDRTEGIYLKLLSWIKKQNRSILDLESTEKTHKYFREEFLIREDEIAGYR